MLRGARSHLQQPPRCPLTPPGRSHTAFGVSRHRCTPPSSLAAAGGARCLLLCAVLVSQPAPCTVPPLSPPIWDATGCWRSLRISASSRGCPGNREVFLQPSRKCHCHDFQRRFLPGHTAAFLPLGPAAHGRTRSQSSASLPLCFFLLLQGPGSSPRCSWPRAGVWLLSWEAAGSCGAVSASAAAQGGGVAAFPPLPGEAVGTGAREAFLRCFNPKSGYKTPAPAPANCFVPLCAHSCSGQHQS